MVLAVLSVALTVVGPRILGMATDLVFAGLIGRSCPAASARSRRRSRSAPRATARSPTWSPPWTTSCPARAWTSARWPPSWRWPSRVYLASALAGIVQGYLLNDVVQGTVRRMRSDVQDKINACR